MAENVIGTSVSAAQLKDFFRQIDDGSITSQIVQAVLEHRNPFEKNTAVVEATEKLLQPLGQVTFTLDPKVEYKKVLHLGQNKGFWIDPNLQKVFDLAKAEDVAPASVTLAKSQILDNKTARIDKNITDELGTHYKISPAAALNLIATELQKVLAGKSSELFNKSTWGLMYVEHLVVLFGWFSVREEWYVSVWSRGDNQWRASNSVFSATEAKKL